MKLPEPTGGGSFTPTPAGQHNAVCARFIDLGTQTSETAYGIKSQRKVLLGWEIPAHRIKWDKDGVEHEGPVMHFERMTFSTHEKALFRQRLESWRGKPFNENDFGNHKDAFDVQKLLGIGALIQITHKHDNGKTYANMTAIMMPPAGKASWAKLAGLPVYLALTKDEFDSATFDSLSENLQNTIRQSPEYQALFDPNDSIEPKGDQTGGNDDFSDDIPF